MDLAIPSLSRECWNYTAQGLGFSFTINILLLSFKALINTTFASKKNSNNKIWVSMICFEYKSGSKQWNFNNSASVLRGEIKTKAARVVQGHVHHFTIDRRNDAFGRLGCSGRLVIWTQSLCLIFYVLIFIIAFQHQKRMSIPGI